VTSRGSWKLAGLGFVADPINDNHGAMVILVTIFVKIFGDCQDPSGPIRGPAVF